MKTRIISGIVAAIVVAVILFVNSFYQFVGIFALSILAAVATFEILNNTGCVKNKAAVICAMVYSALMLFIYSGNFITHTALTVLYVFVMIGFIVFDHKNFCDRQITMVLSMPTLISFAFCCLESLINNHDGAGLLYFFLIFNFACVSDIFAYFVGSAIGKNKLAPEISPKKTIEGAVGGLLGSVVGTAVICLVFSTVLNKEINILILLIATPIFSAIGMLGDLFASAIKRSFCIKDYGNIMPGHGGVLDRLDSVLLVSPALAMFLSFVSVI